MSDLLTVCGICNGVCGMNISLDSGQVTGIKGQEGHPVSRGLICPKGFAVKEWSGASDWIHHPLKKTADGQWQEVSWGEALNTIAQKLGEIKGDFGPETVAIHVGQAGVRKEFTPYAERFARVFGTPNFSSAGSHCHRSKVMANTLTYGALPVPDFANSNCIVLWGSYPQKSLPTQMGFINEARQRGAKLIIIDPRVTYLGKKADLHLQLRPGTDGALALGMLNVIIKEQLYNREFVEKWTVGFDELIKHVAEFTPQKAEEITGLSAQKVVAAARLYAKSSPTCISMGIALELQSNGFQNLRAISILQAITGNLDITGGAMFVPPANLNSLAVEICSEDLKPAVGQDRFPLFIKSFGHAQANVYSDAILEGRPYFLKALIVSGSNPLLTWPNAGKLRKALEKLEFLVVMDHFMTETAKLADIVLPAATFLGRNELWDLAPNFGRQVIGLAPKVMDEQGRMSDWQFWTELAVRMGYRRFFPWKDEEEALDYRLQSIRLTVEELKNYPEGYSYGQLKQRKYETTGFKTASGKVEIYSAVLEQYGYDPLPVYREPAENPFCEKACEYPLILTTGARTLGYTHSRFRSIPSLQKFQPEPLAEIHPETAVKFGIEDEHQVLVETPRGSIELKVRITDEVAPRVLYLSHGWPEANANLLTDNEYLDPVTGFPADRALMARVRRII